MNIVLTGFMGSGKSTVGKILSERLGMGFADTDRMAEKIAGKRLVRIFSEEGEAKFREIESQLALAVSAMDNTVIATGGGFVLRHENMEAIEANGAVFRLDVSVDSVIVRIGHCTDRPLLLSGNSREKIARQLENRSEAYKRADFTITEVHGAEKAAEAIMERIRSAKLCAVIRNREEAEKAQVLGADFVELRIDLMENKVEIPGIISSCKVPVIATNRGPGLEELELEKILEMEMRAGDIGKIVTTDKSEEEVRVIFSLLRKAKEKNFPLIAFLMGEKFADTRVLSVLKGGFLAFASVGEPVAEGQMGFMELKRRLGK
ncbi:MAG: type I 3-dehydroquinate dehydratase [Candidatus Diapherotrites archaeon]|nr:type I 3-dehydroquinate dehydratase [Candidatus Diapherotrites archaeon]